jgi:hypothetical protein
VAAAAGAEGKQHAGSIGGSLLHWWVRQHILKAAATACAEVPTGCRMLHMPWLFLPSGCHGTLSSPSVEEYQIIINSRQCTLRVSES